MLWENYTSFTHFLPKIVVGIFFTIATSILWMLLSVPSAECVLSHSVQWLFIVFRRKALKGLRCGCLVVH